MKDLSEIRQKIDQIDDELSQLYLKRMALSSEVAESKKQSGKPIWDSERENKIVYRLSQKAPSDMTLFLKELYSTIFYTSRAYQSKLINKLNRYNAYK